MVVENGCHELSSNHHHHVVPLARISLSLSRHFSLSFIVSGRSSGLHSVSSHSCRMYVRAGRPAFARPYVGAHRSTSLKAWTAIDKLSIIWKSNLSDKMKRSFFQAAAVSILLYGCTTWTLTKRLEKKLDGNYTRMLRVIFNKSWWQHPTKHQLYGHLPPITKTIQVRRTRHAGHCWRSRDELISELKYWTKLFAFHFMLMHLKKHKSLSSTKPGNTCKAECALLPRKVTSQGEWKTELKTRCWRHGRVILDLIKKINGVKKSRFPTLSSHDILIVEVFKQVKSYIGW